MSDFREEVGHRGSKMTPQNRASFSGQFAQNVIDLTCVSDGDKHFLNTFNQIEPLKNGPFLVLLSSFSRDLLAPKTKIIFQFL